MPRWRYLALASTSAPPFSPQLTATPGSPVAAGTATTLAATVSWQIGPLTTTGGVTFTDGDTPSTPCPSPCPALHLARQRSLSLCHPVIIR